jgi:hypothetical protein
MMMSMIISVRPTLLHPPLHVLHSLSIAPHNIPDMFDAIEVILQLIDLSHNVVEACYLGVCHLDRIAGTVILLLCHERRLLGQIV